MKTHGLRGMRWLNCSIQRDTAYHATGVAMTELTRHRARYDLPNIQSI